MYFLHLLQIDFPNQIKKSEFFMKKNLKCMKFVSSSLVLFSEEQMMGHQQKEGMGQEFPIEKG